MWLLPLGVLLPVVKLLDWPPVLGWLFWKLLEEVETVPTISITCVPEAAGVVIVEVAIGAVLLQAFVFAAAVAEDEAEDMGWEGLSEWG